MNRILASMAVALTAATSSLLADGHTLAWTGFSLGVHAGIGKTDTAYTTIPPTPASLITTVNQNDTGFIFGANAGYDHQFGDWIIGIEGDYTRLNLSSRFLVTTGPFNNQYFIADVDWTASLRGRLGYAVSDYTMFYAIAGVAWAEEEHGVVVPFACVNDCRANDTHTGYIVGAGVEHMLTKDWVVGAEYTYSDFGKQSFPVPTAPPGFASLYAHSFDFDLHQFNIRLKYEF